MVEYDPFDIDAMVANATDAEFGSDNTDERYNIDRYTGQGVEGPDEESMEEFSNSQIARSLARRLQKILGQYTPGVISIYVDPAFRAGSISGQLNSLHTLSMKAVYFCWFLFMFELFNVSRSCNLSSLRQ